MAGHTDQPYHEAAVQLVDQRQTLYADREAVRLSHHELFEGLTIDDYAGHLLLTDYAGHDKSTLRRAGEACLEALAANGRPAHGAVSKIRPDNLSHTQADPSPRLVAGSPPPPRWTVREAEAKFAISFDDAGFSTGLFLDMACGRQWVHEHARDAEVLNLFSYTGPFSIRAATGGAHRIIEVDTSRKWLRWAQDNQQLNDVKQVRQRADDAVKFLSRQADDSFDMIICDPPSYARGKGSRRFTIDQGYRTMAPHLARVVRAGGMVVACCNHAGTESSTFAGWLERCGLQVRQWLETPGDFAQADYLKIALAERSR
jgi:23S rRNA (cytosine1962-C5)-methyltransferase